jgi:hypothetical protein
MAMVASCYFFIQTKNPFDEILSLSFNSGPLKVNTYGIRHESIL